MPAKSRRGIQINTVGMNAQQLDRLRGHYRDVHTASLHSRLPQLGLFRYRLDSCRTLALCVKRRAQNFDMATKFIRVPRLISQPRLSASSGGKKNPALRALFSSRPKTGWVKSQVLGR